MKSLLQGFLFISLFLGVDDYRDEGTTLIDETLEPGDHTAHWNGTNASGAAVPTGVHLYRLKAGKETRSRKMVLLE